MAIWAIKNSLPSHLQWIFFSKLHGKFGSPWGKNTFLLHQLQIELGPCTSFPFRDTIRDHHLWTWKQLWSGPAHWLWSAVWVQLLHCCSLSRYPISLSVSGMRSVRRKRGRSLEKVTEFSQHSCDALALVKGCVKLRTQNTFCLILKLPGFPCHWPVLFTLCISSARMFSTWVNPGDSDVASIP